MSAWLKSLSPSPELVMTDEESSFGFICTVSGLGGWLWLSTGGEGGTWTVSFGKLASLMWLVDALSATSFVVSPITVLSSFAPCRGSIACKVLGRVASRSGETTW